MQSFNNYINFIFSTRLTVDKQIPTYLDIWNATYLLHSKLNSCGKSNRTHCSKLNLEHSITDCNSPSKLVRNEPNSNPAVGQPLSHTQHTHTIAQSPTHMHAQTQTKAACGFDRANHSHINIRALCANFLAFWDLKNWTGMWMVLFSTKPVQLPDQLPYTPSRVRDGLTVCPSMPNRPGRWTTRNDSATLHDQHQHRRWRGTSILSITRLTLFFFLVDFSWKTFSISTSVAARRRCCCSVWVCVLYVPRISEKLVESPKRDPSWARFRAWSALLMTGLVRIFGHCLPISTVDAETAVRQNGDNDKRTGGFEFPKNFATLFW